MTLQGLTGLKARTAFTEKLSGLRKSSDTIHGDLLETISMSDSSITSYPLALLAFYQNMPIILVVHYRDYFAL